MTRVVEHRSALPFGPVLALHVRRGAGAEAPVLATIEASLFGKSLDPEAFPKTLPVADAFLEALAYAERTGIACVWVDDPGGHFPPARRPARDAS
jgi:hypothetical protein